MIGRNDESRINCVHSILYGWEVERCKAMSSYVEDGLYQSIGSPLIQGY